MIGLDGHGSTHQAVGARPRLAPTDGLGVRTPHRVLLQIDVVFDIVSLCSEMHLKSTGYMGFDLMCTFANDCRRAVGPESVLHHHHCVVWHRWHLLHLRCLWYLRRIQFEISEINGFMEDIPDDFRVARQMRMQINVG